MGRKAERSKMEPNDQPDVKNSPAFLFAEHVRREAIRLFGLTHKDVKAPGVALALNAEAARFQRELLGLPEPEPDDYQFCDEDDFDLNDLAILMGTKGNEQSGEDGGFDPV